MAGVFRALRNFFLFSFLLLYPAFGVRPGFDGNYGFYLCIVYHNIARNQTPRHRNISLDADRVQ